MIIYNVSIKTTLAIHKAWIEWLIKEHAPEMLATGLFLKYQVCRLLDQEEDGSATFVVQYYCKDMQSYQTYIDKYSESMRAKGYEKFGNQFVGFRTLMEVLDSNDVK